MEMAIKLAEPISIKNITTEKKGGELKVITSKAKSVNPLLECEDICDGDIWEWNLIYGIGNDVY